MASQRGRFKLIKQGELSYAVEFDGQHMDEWSERDGAQAYIEFWSGKLNASIEECAKIADENQAYAHKYGNLVGEAVSAEIATAIRALAEEE